MSSREVRVAVVGDAGVGKSSLISTAAKDTFDSRPPPVLPPTRLPAEFSTDHTPMLVTDTSSRPEEQQSVDHVITNSDVVVVCFDATRQATLDNIRTSWYPRIQRLNPDVPVIMACCKADRLEGERETQLLRDVSDASLVWILNGTVHSAHCAAAVDANHHISAPFEQLGHAGCTWRCRMAVLMRAGHAWMHHNMHHLVPHPMQVDHGGLHAGLFLCMVHIMDMAPSHALSYHLCALH